MRYSSILFKVNKPDPKGEGVHKSAPNNSMERNKSLFFTRKSCLRFLSFNRKRPLMTTPITLPLVFASNFKLIPFICATRLGVLVDPSNDHCIHLAFETKLRSAAAPRNLFSHGRTRLLSPTIRRTRTGSSRNPIGYCNDGGMAL